MKYLQKMFIFGNKYPVTKFFTCNILFTLSLDLFGEILNNLQFAMLLQFWFCLINFSFYLINLLYIILHNILVSCIRSAFPKLYLVLIRTVQQHIHIPQFQNYSYFSTFKTQQIIIDRSYKPIKFAGVLITISWSCYLRTN